MEIEARSKATVPASLSGGANLTSSAAFAPVLVESVGNTISSKQTIAEESHNTQVIGLSGPAECGVAGEKLAKQGLSSVTQLTAALSSIDVSSEVLATTNGDGAFISG